MAEHEDPRVSAGYRALGEERPPQALDDAILAASRRAVGAGPRRAGTSRVRRWALPVSIAAVVVLTMSLVVRIQLERPDFDSPLPAPAAPIPAAPPAAEKNAAPRDAKEEADALAKRNAQLLAEPKAKARAEPPAVAERERSMSLERQGARAPAAPAPAPAADPPARGFVAEPPAPKSAPAPAPAESAAPAQLGAASGVAPAAAPGIPEGRADRAPSGKPQAGGRVASRAALEDRAQVSAEQAGKKDESPREWLERIARLRREGRVKEADDSLVEFRRRYPDHEIPKDLREAVLGAGAR
jgi:hypothetical protein